MAPRMGAVRTADSSGRLVGKGSVPAEENCEHTSYISALSLGKHHLVLAMQSLNLIMGWKYGRQEDNL